MPNLINIIICKLTAHRLFMFNLDTVDIQYDQYTGQEYVYCVRCKAYLPLHNLD